MYVPKIKTSLMTSLLLAVVLALGAVTFGFPSRVSAQSCGDLSGPDVQACQTRIDGCDATLQGSDTRFRDGCRQTVYSDFGLSSSSTDPTRGSNLQGDCKDTDRDGQLEKTECGIVGYIITFINVLSGLVGVVIVIMIAVGGIQYTTARDDPQAVAAAKARIRNAILALVFYLFGFSFLQWLIPGGIF